MKNPAARRYGNGALNFFHIAVIDASRLNVEANAGARHEQNWCFIADRIERERQPLLSADV